MAVGLILSKLLIFAFIPNMQCMAIPPNPVEFLELYTRITQNRIWPAFTHIHASEEMRAMFPGPSFKTQNDPPTWELDLNSD